MELLFERNRIQFEDLLEDFVDFCDTDDRAFEVRVFLKLVEKVGHWLQIVC